MSSIQLVNGVARNQQVRLATPASFSLLDGEHIAIVGANGSGKTLLVDTLLGKYPLREGQLDYHFTETINQAVYNNIRYIAFRDTYGAADANYYYQQRWNAHDQDEIPTVSEMLGEVTDDSLRDRLFSLFQLTPLLDKKIIHLSSGELRKFQLAKALLTAPRILIIDNPFIGLDASTRSLLTDLLQQLTEWQHLQLIVVQSMLDDVPPFVTHVVPVEQMTVGRKLTRQAYLDGFAATCCERFRQVELDVRAQCQSMIDLPVSDRHYDALEVVKLDKVSIAYGARTILKDLDWMVRSGEKWAISGDNGSGKSTLLSLVCADNPQSYACRITLFDRPRGSGESIWEIKKHIGYVSPEMHRAYRKNLPAIEIVASGLHDSIGLYRRPQPAQMSVCEWWMRIFGIGELCQRPFLQLSSGEQRLVLLARAFVKDPELLILDEPLHGLDTYHRLRVKALIEAFCRRPHKTLIMVTHYAEELPDIITHRLHLTKC